MIFNSLQYALFLPIVVILYFLLPQKFRWIFLLAASYFFYMCWNAKYALLLLMSTVTTYFSAMLMHKAKSHKAKNLYLIFCLAINLGVLFLFKYFNFFNQTIADAAHLTGLRYQPSKLSLLLPVGISFYTFMALGYLFDVYKGKAEPTKHFGKFALFVSFFPQIAAGPIGRIESLRPQFDMPHRFDPEKIRSGMLLIGRGLIKKLVIADRLAVLVNAVYDSPNTHSGIHFLIATVFFSIQIYCDFSGYSDIAIGSAKLLGIDLMENFRRPYMAVSAADFWKRWHISLTSWFRDYLYIPLGGNRKRHLTNILIVFLVSGLWHGANLTFILWGFLNGLYQVAGIVVRPYTDRLKAALKIDATSVAYNRFKKLTTFLLISFAWIFFRANNLGDLQIILTKLFTWNASFLAHLSLASLGVDLPDLVLSIILIVVLLIYERVEERAEIGTCLWKKSLVSRWAVYLSVIAVIILLGVYGNANGEQFIYFKF